MKKQVTKQYEINGADNINVVLEYLAEQDLNYRNNDIDDDYMIFIITFYNAKERDEFDYWLEENIV